nr:MAG TPA: hypothetical protein [Caudoviricetes sp.]
MKRLRTIPNTRSKVIIFSIDLFDINFTQYISPLKNKFMGRKKHPSIT